MCISSEGPVDTDGFPFYLIIDESYNIAAWFQAVIWTKAHLKIITPLGKISSGILKSIQ